MATISCEASECPSVITAEFPCYGRVCRFFCACESRGKGFPERQAGIFRTSSAYIIQRTDKHSGKFDQDACRGRNFYGKHGITLRKAVSPVFPGRKTDAGGERMYEVKTAAEVLRILGTDKDKGLNRREAMERKARYGANKLKDQEKKSLGQMILEQLNDPLILILVVAMAISLMLHELGDAVIIVTVVALNATVGIIQEGKAGKAVEALKKISSPQAVVLREGERMKSLPLQESLFPWKKMRIISWKYQVTTAVRIWHICLLT